MSARKYIHSWQELTGAALLKKVLKRRDIKVAVTSSFGTESAVLLDMVAAINPATPVIFVDTGRLFVQTHAYRETLTRHLGLLDVRVVKPAMALVANADPQGLLHQSDPDACCQVRKVTPFAMAVADFDVLITGRKRHHGDERLGLHAVEEAGLHVKVNPLAHDDAAAIEAAFVRRKLPRHPLAAAGYASIGCEPCTHRTCPGQGVRAGRWSNHAKTECGIHTNHISKL